MSPFVFFVNHVLVYFNSAMGYPTYYPIRPVEIKRADKAAW